MEQRTAEDLQGARLMAYSFLLFFFFFSKDVTLHAIQLKKSQGTCNYTLLLFV